MKKTKKVWFVVLLVLGIIASGCIYFAFNANMVDVVIANSTMQGNVEIKSSMVSTKKVDKASLPDNYISAEYLKDMGGRYTNIGITKGSVFTTGNVSTKDSKKAAVIPAGKTLLSIKIDSLPQGVVAGDNVNILVGMTISGKGKVVVTYQNVLVTNTIVNVDGNVTGLEVEVSPAQAQKIQFAQINGELSVSLLPLGYESQELPVVNEEDVKVYSSDEKTKTDNEETNTNNEKTRNSDNEEINDAE